MRQFDNPFNISKAIAFRRVRNLDAAAEVGTYRVTRIDQSIANYINVDSSLADAALEGLFNQAETAEETQYLADSTLDKQQIKDAYLNMIARLEQIQAAVNPTNAQVIQAIKDEALYIERIMKVIARLIT